jgi:hypothetical protein
MYIMNTLEYLKNLEEIADSLEEKYINKLNKHYKSIIKNKYNKYLQNLLSITHMSGVHLDFYHKPYIFLSKKNPELIFRNVILKKINILNKLMYKEIFLIKESVEIMIRQCELAIENKDYWIRYGYKGNQVDTIFETYNIFKQFLIDYLKYQEDNKHKFDKDTMGLGKTKKGEELYEFILKSYSGFEKITPEYLQNLAVLCFRETLNKIEEHTKLHHTDAIIKYKNSLKYFESEKDFMSTAKYNIIKLRRKAETLFKDYIELPYTEKISIKPIPKLRALWGTEAKAQNNTLFINTEHWRIIDHNYLLRICAHEGIPGHIIERHNSNNVLKDYKLKKKIKKYIQKGNLFSVEGWATYSEHLINDMYTGDTIMTNLYHDLLNYIKIIIDVGLNSRNAPIKFNMKSAFNFIKKYTMQENSIIYNELIRFFAKPGFFISYGMGNLLIKELIRETKFDTKTFNSLYLTLPLTIPLMREYMMEIKYISNLSKN